MSDLPVTPKPDLVKIARRQRHAALLEKMQKGNPLTQAELKELQKYEGAEDPKLGMIGNRGELARAFRVSVRTIDNWIREGMPRHEDGSFDIVDVEAWRASREEKPEGQVKEKDKWESHFRKNKALIAELQYRKMLGDLITREEVEQERVQRILTIKKALLSLPGRLAPQVVNVDVKAAEEIIKKRIEEIIQDFSRGGAGILEAPSGD